jgi:hypothetical protein
MSIVPFWGNVVWGNIIRGNAMVPLFSLKTTTLNPGRIQSHALISADTTT